MIKKFRKKPVVIEAVQYKGNNKKEITKFTEGNANVNGHFDFVISTLEGTHEISLQDWVIKGIRGEFYPCKPNIFEETYEEVKK